MKAMDLHIQLLSLLLLLQCVSLSLQQVFPDDNEDCYPRFDERLKGCMCNEKDAGYTVRCLYQNKTVDIFPHIPPNTEQAVFRGNRFMNLPDEAMFGDLGKSIRVLDLDNNNIQLVSGRSFNKLIKLETLVLSDNDLFIAGVKGSEHPRMFTSLQNLKNLNLRDTFTELIESSKTMQKLVDILWTANLTMSLSYLNLELNELREFTPELPSYLSVLRNLTLAHNDISKVNVIAESMTNLEGLDLRNNSIKSLEHNTLVGLQRMGDMYKLRKVYISLNPFLCDCTAAELHYWLHNTTLMSPEEKGEVRCDGKGRRVMDLRMEDMACNFQTKTADDDGGRRPHAPHHDDDTHSKNDAGHNNNNPPRAEDDEGGLSNGYIAMAAILVIITVLSCTIMVVNRQVLLQTCYTTVLRPISPLRKYVHIENESEGAECHV